MGAASFVEQESEAMTMRVRTAFTALLLTSVVFLIALGSFAVLADESILTKEHPPVAVRASWVPLEELNGHQLAYGDRVAAELRIAVDSRRVDPDTLRLPPPKWGKLFAPYRVVGSAERTEEREGSTTVILYRVVLECRSGGACLPRGKTKQFIFSEKRITYLDTTTGLVESVFAWWPPLSVASRIPPNPDPGIEIFVASPEVRGVTTRMPPTMLIILFGLAAVILFLGAVLLGAYALRKKRPQLIVHELPAVETISLLSALMLMERYLNNPRSEPRELHWAFEHVCRGLKVAGHTELALQAERFAWDDEAIDHHALREFVREIRTIRGGVR